MALAGGNRSLVARTSKRGWAESLPPEGGSRLRAQRRFMQGVCVCYLVYVSMFHVLQLLPVGYTQQNRVALANLR